MAIIKKVAYSKTYQLPFASFWEKIFVEADVEAGEDARKALYECKRTVENFHFESNKAAEKEVSAKDQEKPPLNRTDSIIRDIGTVKDLKVLESYQLIAKNNPEIKIAFDNKLKQLQND